MRSVIAFAVLGVVALIALLPKIIHGFDSGEETLPVAKMQGGYKPASRNLVIEGLLDVGHSVEKRTTKRGATISRRTYMPLVPAGWTKNDPVHVIYSTSAWLDIALDRMARQPTHKGLLRNVLWEGVPGAVKDRFNQMGLKLADDLVLVDER